MCCKIVVLAGCLVAPFGSGPARAHDDVAAVEFTLVEKGTANLLPCRLHVKDKAGKPLRAGSLPFWHDHFVCPGTATLKLARGDYTYEVEHGPEYERRRGAFKVEGAGPITLRMDLQRLANLAKESWWSGELHVHRPVSDIEMLMRAEDLHVAPVITWWNNRNEWSGRKRLPENPLVRFDRDRYYHLLAGEDEREGGALLFFNLTQPLDITRASREYPSPMKFVAEARRQRNAWIDVEKPFWWDVPVWLAGAKVDSIGLANNHMCRSQMYENEAWGKPRDTRRLPPPLGNGFWTQEIYYHILDCGLRIPPSAGSASGVLPNPVGYNRVYVHVEGPLSYDKWWEGLRAGSAFVTNGPLLRVLANGQLPGHIFTGPDGEEVELNLKAAVTTQDPIRCLEIIKDGRVERAVPFDDWTETGTLGSVCFQKSGWFLVRAVADNPKTFRFASTSPYYVEIGDVKRRVSKSSAKFFLDWVRERANRVKLEDAAQRQEVLKYHAHAQNFWERVLANANSE